MAAVPNRGRGGGDRRTGRRESGGWRGRRHRERPGVKPQQWARTELGCDSTSCRRDRSAHGSRARAGTALPGSFSFLAMQAKGRDTHKEVRAGRRAKREGEREREAGFGRRCPPWNLRRACPQPGVGGSDHRSGRPRVDSSSAFASSGWRSMEMARAALRTDLMDGY
jgi:hypothetical protein